MARACVKHGVLYCGVTYTTYHTKQLKARLLNQLFQALPLRATRCVTPPLPRRYWEAGGRGTGEKEKKIKKKQKAETREAGPRRERPGGPRDSRAHAPPLPVRETRPRDQEMPGSTPARGHAPPAPPALRGSPPGSGSGHPWCRPAGEGRKRTRPDKTKKRGWAGGNGCHQAV